MIKFILIMFLLFSAIEFKAETKIEYNLPTQYDVGDYAQKFTLCVIRNAQPLLPLPIMPSSMVEGLITEQNLPDKYGLKVNRNITFNTYNRPVLASFSCPMLVPWLTLPSYYLGYKNTIRDYFTTYGLAN